MQSCYLAPSQYITTRQSRGLFATKHDPGSPDFSGASTMEQREIHNEPPPKFVRIRFYRIDAQHRVQNRFAQLRRVGRRHAQRRTEYPRLVTTARMRRTETVVSQFGDVNDCPIRVRQAHCDQSASNNLARKSWTARLAAMASGWQISLNEHSLHRLSLTGGGRLPAANTARVTATVSPTTVRN